MGKLLLLGGVTPEHLGLERVDARLLRVRSLGGKGALHGRHVCSTMCVAKCGCRHLLAAAAVAPVAVAVRKFEKVMHKSRKIDWN